MGEFLLTWLVLLGLFFTVFSGLTNYRSPIGYSLNGSINLLLLGILVPIFRWDLVSIYLQFIFPAAAFIIYIYVFIRRRADFVQNWRDSTPFSKGVAVAAPLLTIFMLTNIWHIAAPQNLVTLSSLFTEGEYFVAQGGNSKIYNHHFGSRAQNFPLILQHFHR